MPFDFTGSASLRRFEIFVEVLASSVTDTGLAYHFKFPDVLKNVDAAFDMFQFNTLFFMEREYERFQRKSDPDIFAQRLMFGFSALAMHSISMHRLFDKSQINNVDEKVVGIHRVAIQKNPTELVALTFGLAIAEIYAEWKRSPTGLVLSPARVDLRAITRADIRGAIMMIAANRNLDVAAGNGQFQATFVRMSRLFRKLQAHRMRG